MAELTIENLLAKERETPLGWYCLFFRNRQGQFTHATIIQARGLGGALVVAAEHGLTPHGSGRPVLETGESANGRHIEAERAPDALRYKLVSMNEVHRIAPHLVPKTLVA